MAGRGVGSEGGGESGRETPASDGYPDTRRDLYGDAEMSDRREGVEGNDVTGESEHRRTDHERQRSGQNTVMKMPASAPPLHKLHTTRKYRIVQHVTIMYSAKLSHYRSHSAFTAAPFAESHPALWFAADPDLGSET